MARPNYRRLKGSDTWHFCANCPALPTSCFEEIDEMPAVGELCKRCEARKRKEDCVAL